MGKMQGHSATRIRGCSEEFRRTFSFNTFLNSLGSSCFTRESLEKIADANEGVNARVSASHSCNCMETDVSCKSVWKRVVRSRSRCPDLRQRCYRRDGRQRPTEKWEAVQQQVRNFTCSVKVIDHPPPRYAWFLTFSPEGKIIEIHEYLNTALLERVYAENKS